MRRKSLLALFLVVGSVAAFGQKNELGLVFGGVLSPNGTTTNCPAVFNPPVNCTASAKNDPVLGVEGVYAHRLVNFHVASLHAEFPILATPERVFDSGVFSRRYSSLYFTPSLKLKLSAPVLSPWVSVGGGLAHFSPKNASSSDSGAFQVGAGADLGTPVPLLGIRLEGREFFTGRPNLFGDQPSRHNVFLGGGIVLRF